MNNLKSYTEYKGKEPFNWNKFLNKKKITKKEWEEAFKLSNQ